MKKYAPMAALLVFMILMLVRPEYYIQSATRGLSLFATAVLPALFPFFFCATLLTKIGGARVISQIGRKPTAFLFNSPPEGAYILTLSMLSGYPVGASMTAELFKKGMLTRDEAKTVCAYASTSGPIFILGTLGGVIFKNPAVGAVILSAHYLGAILNGIVFRTRKNAERSPVRTADMLGDEDALAQSISHATLSMLAVGGYIVLAGMLIDTLVLFSVPDKLYAVLPADYAGPVNSLIFGVIEMTRGGLECAKISNLQLASAIAAALVSGGGLCVFMQSFTFLSTCKIKFSEMLVRKITQAAITFALAFLFGFALN